MSAEPINTYNPAVHPSYRLALLLGAGGAGLAALGVVAPWTLGLVGAAVVFGLAFLENETFLLSLVFLMPLDFTLREGAPLRDLDVAARLLVFIGYFLGRLSRQQLDIKRLWRPAVTRASCLFLASLLLSVLLGGSSGMRAELRGVYFIGSYIAYYLVMLDWLRIAERRRRMVFALLCSTLIVGVFAVIQEFVGDYTSVWYFLYRGNDWDLADLASILEQGRMPSFLGAHSHLAGYLNLVLPFGIASYLLSKERRWKRLSALTVILGVIGLTLAQARGGYLAFAAIVIYATCHFAKTRRQKVLLLLVFGCLAAGAYRLLQQLRPTRFVEYASDHSVWGRLLLWNTAWNFFLSSPLHGLGIGTFPLIYAQYMPNIPGMDFSTQLEAHNIYFELLAETGILGFLSFFGVIVTAYREARRQLASADWFQHAFAFGVAAGVIGALVGGFFDHCVFWSPQVGFLFWLGAGSLVASSQSGSLPAPIESV